MMLTKFQDPRPFGSGEEGFYHIWAWRPSWSCDQDHLSRLSFSYPIETPYGIWLWLAQWFLRRTCLKSVDDHVVRWTKTDDVRRTSEAYLSYKLNKWAFGSGELKTMSNCTSVKFQIIDDSSFWKIHCFAFFPYKSIRGQIRPYRKIGQGQPRIIIWASLVVLEHPMMLTKFQDPRPFGSREEGF